MAGNPTFELHAIDRTLVLPSGSHHPVITLVFRIRNGGDPLLFSFIDTWRLVVTDPTGKALPNFGNDSGAIDLTKADFPIIRQGQVATLNINLYLLRGPERFHFYCDDLTGGFYGFAPIHAGRYKIRLQYTQTAPLVFPFAGDYVTDTLHKKPDDLWKGSATTNSVVITVRNK